MRHLNQELKTASNIKDKNVRNPVTKALKNLLNNINKFTDKNKVPTNGLVMLSGQIDNDIEYYV